MLELSNICNHLRNLSTQIPWKRRFLSIKFRYTYQVRMSRKKGLYWSGAGLEFSFFECFDYLTSTQGKELSICISDTSTNTPFNLKFPSKWQFHASTMPLYWCKRWYLESQYWSICLNGWNISLDSRLLSQIPRKAISCILDLVD